MLEENNSLSHRYIFVFGAQRTGTTLLHRLLSNHPRISGTPNDFDLLRICKGTVFDKRQWPKLCEWNLELDLNEYFKLTQTTEQGVLVKVLERYFRDDINPVRLHKTPKGELVLDTYREAFKDSAKFIYTIRNPFAIMASRKYWGQNKSGRWFSTKYEDISLRSLDKTIHYMKQSLYQIFESIKIIDLNFTAEDTLGVVVYEKLVSNPKLTLNNTLKGIGFKCVKKMFLGLEEQGQPYTSYPELSEGSGIYCDSIDMWKEKLLDIEFALIYNELKAFCRDYEFESNHIKRIFIKYLEEAGGINCPKAD